jgi:hypothetical protein
MFSVSTIGLQTGNFSRRSRTAIFIALMLRVVYEMYKHPVLLYPVRQTLPMNRTVIILKFKPMKKSFGFNSLAERAAVHAAPHALCLETGWHLSCRLNIRSWDNRKQELQVQATNCMAQCLSWKLVMPTVLTKFVSLMKTKNSEPYLQIIDTGL